MLTFPLNILTKGVLHDIGVLLHYYTQHVLWLLNYYTWYIGSMGSLCLEGLPLASLSGTRVSPLFEETPLLVASNPIRLVFFFCEDTLGWLSVSRDAVQDVTHARRMSWQGEYYRSLNFQQSLE